jgi:Ser/Thr protein kinase RdoA (MazF antagonist)
MLAPKDILLLVLAFCILWFTVFVSWAIYYVAMILREVKTMMGDFRRKMELLDKVLNAFKDKLESTSSHLKLLVETAVNVAEFIKDRKSEKEKKKK